MDDDDYIGRREYWCCRACKGSPAYKGQCEVSAPEGSTQVPPDTCPFDDDAEPEFIFMALA